MARSDENRLNNERRFITAAHFWAEALRDHGARSNEIVTHRTGFDVEIPPIFLSPGPIDSKKFRRKAGYSSGLRYCPVQVSAAKPRSGRSRRRARPATAAPKGPAGSACSLRFTELYISDKIILKWNSRRNSG